MIDQQLAALTRKVRETLESGRVIAVLGWRKTFHTRFTRRLPDRRVRFYRSDSPPTEVAPTIGLVLCTPHVRHSHVAVLRRSNSEKVYPIVIKYRTIAEILHDCRDLLVVEVQDSARQAPARDHRPAAAPPEEAVRAEEVVVSEATQIPKEVETMADMSAFTQEFIARAKAEGEVGRKVLGVMLRKHGITETTQQLLKDGWFVPHKKNGSSTVGYYTPGSKMGPLAQLEPEDPIERARFLIAQADGLLAEKGELQARLEAVEGKLTQIDTARKLIAKLAEVMTPKP